MLTPSETRTLKFIQKYFVKSGYAPTLQEIAQGTGIKSRGVIHRYLRALQSSDLITILPNRKRGIRLNLEANENALAAPIIPLLGRIAAGQPIAARTGCDIMNPHFCAVRERSVSCQRPPLRPLVTVHLPNFNQAGQAIAHGRAEAKERRPAAGRGGGVAGYDSRNQGRGKRGMIHRIWERGMRDGGVAGSASPGSVDPIRATDCGT